MKLNTVLAMLFSIIIAFPVSAGKWGVVSDALMGVFKKETGLVIKSISELRDFLAEKIALKVVTEEKFLAKIAYNRGHSSPYSGADILSQIKNISPNTLCNVIFDKIISTAELASVGITDVINKKNGWGTKLSGSEKLTESQILGKSFNNYVTSRAAMDLYHKHNCFDFLERGQVSKFETVESGLINTFVSRIKDLDL
jgi:hypothetical protein